jgi:hypothetical protein
VPSAKADGNRYGGLINLLQLALANCLGQGLFLAALATLIQTSGLVAEKPKY